MADSAEALGAVCASALKRLRAERPRVHVITNTVAQPITANGLLALGAIPSLTTDPEEVPDFVGRARALVINLGTLDRTRRAAIDAAVDVARAEQRPFVLDPVFADVAPARCAFAKALLDRDPTVVRPNLHEFKALFGTEADDLSGMADAAASALTVIAVTGAIDRVSDGERLVNLQHGVPVMDRVTAIGCLTSAVIGAYLGVTRNAFEAAVAGLVTVGMAGEIAARATDMPGSFAVTFLDALAMLEADDLATQLRLAGEGDAA
ncbi:MAG: hydroxyethylthiazole kinase [Pseudomonadota bacterium]